MSSANPTIIIKDSATFTLYEADLTGKKVGDRLKTPKRVVPCSDALQWWIDYSPAGWKEVENHLSVFLWVAKSVKATFTFTVNVSSISKTGTHEYPESPQGCGWDKYASHEKLRPLFHDGKLTVTCSIEFNILAPVFSIPRNFQLFEHVATDVEFAIGSQRVPAHKSFLALVSPVFQAMFTHDTTESKSSKIVITEFDFDTVKTAIDVCYGRECKKRSVETVVGILRFCDKYFITAVINEIEKLPILNPSVETFCPIVSYAYDCNKDLLLTTCYTCFKDHQDEIKVTEKFAELPPKVVVSALKFAFNLKTDFDVLRHAYKNGIDFVVTDLEKPLLNSLTIENFCDIVSYAWVCSREELQQACAKYVNENRDEVLNLKAFHNLPSDVIANVLKGSYNELEKLPLLNPSVETFCPIVQYAYDCNKDSLLTTCYNFLKQHQAEIKATKKFAELPLTLVVDTLKSAFNLKTDFDVLRHAHNNGIEVVMIYLEKPLLKSLTIDNFCDTVSYAWECSRKELQQACAKFLNERRDEVENLKAFLSLPSDIVGNVYKARFALKHGDD